jgi:SAM-dependent methyltransferase
VVEEVERDARQNTATPARIYDYLLGGVHNFPADRQVAQTVIASFPMAQAGIRANRGFLQRVVRHLTTDGVRQFLDVGSGIPTVGNVHEIAQSIAPETRVVYVDTDPVAVAESLTILEGNSNATAIRGDLLEPETILDHPQVRAVLDFDQPIALLMVALLHFVADDAGAHAAVGRLREALPPGSYLVLSHVTDDGQDFSEEGVKDVEAAYRSRASTTGKLRSRAEIESFFAGLDMVDPGLVWVPEWRPEPGDWYVPEFARDPRLSMTLAGVGQTR